MITWHNLTTLITITGDSGKIQKVINSKKKKIETRIQRQVLLEDGKIIADSGPQVISRTFEDHKTENEEKTRGGNKSSNNLINNNQQILYPSLQYYNYSPSDAAKVIKRSSSLSSPFIPLDSDPVIRETSTINRTEKSASKEIFHYSDHEIRELTSESDHQTAAESPADLLEPMDNVILNTIKGKLKFYSNKSKKLIQKDKITEKSRLDKDGNIRIQTTQSREEEHFSDEEIPEQYANGGTNGNGKHHPRPLRHPYSDDDHQDEDDDTHRKTIRKLLADDGIQIENYNMDTLSRRRRYRTASGSSTIGSRGRSTSRSRLAIGYEPIVVEIPTQPPPDFRDNNDSFTHRTSSP